MTACLALMLWAGAASAGGYGGPTTTVALSESGATVLRGGRGGWVIDGRTVIGGQGMGTSEWIGQGEGIRFGGLFVERIFPTELGIHPAVEVSFGGGEIWQSGVYAAAMVGTAGAHADIELMSWVRLSLGGGYIVTLPQGDVAGRWRLGRPSLDMMFKFGSF